MVWCGFELGWGGLGCSAIEVANLVMSFTPNCSVSLGC